VGAELFHADGQMDGQTVRETDMTKLIIVFCNSVHVLKKRKICTCPPNHIIISQMTVIFKTDYFLCSLYAMSDIKYTMHTLS
jgi:hypothetical protein